MRNLVIIFISIVLVICGVDTLGQNKSFGYKKATRPEGQGLTFGNVFGFGNVNGLLPGAIYLSVSAGPSFILGDITGPASKAFSLGINNMASIGVSRIFRGNLGYELSFMYGQYDGSDIGSNLDHRGYCYSSKIGEVSLSGECYIFGGPYSRHKFHSLYISGGVGIMFSNCNSYGKSPCPQRIYQNSWTSPDIPYGACYLIGINRTIQIGIEATEHYAFSDYLDGVNPSTSGNKANDFLSHFALKLRLRLYQDNEYQ